MKNLSLIANRLLSLQAQLIGYFQFRLFNCALCSSQKAQRDTLLRILKTNQISELGQKYNFTTIQ